MSDPRSLQVPPEPEFETLMGKASGIIVRKKNAKRAGNINHISVEQ